MSTYMFTPRVPMRHAERHVDFQLHYDHVTARRAEVERLAERRAKRIVHAAATTGHAPLPQVQLLAGSLEQSLYHTAVFGYREVRREVESLRAGPAQARLHIHDAGGYSRVAREGLNGIKQLLHHRAQVAASAVATAAANAARKAQTQAQTSDLATKLAVATATTRMLHNQVLELVGETLNLGRAAGALSLAQPPEYALRSEQLDSTTCDACTDLHGEIAVVDSGAFWDLMPPNGCYGRGRCRGIMVFGDSAEQMDQLDEAA